MALDIARLAQDPRNRIRKVAWSPLGGMLFLRVAWKANENSIPPEGIATVSGLPDVFGGLTDLFRPFKTESVDPNVDVDKNKSDTTEPITDDALNKFLYWQPKPPIKKVEGGKGDPMTVYYGTNGAEFDQDTAFQLYPGGGTDLCGVPVTNIGAWGAAYLNCNDPEARAASALLGQVITSNDGYSGDRSRVELYVKGLNLYFEARGITGNHFHVAALELRPSPTSQTLSHYAVIILNIKKLKRYAPRDQDGKQAKIITFTIEANEYRSTSKRSGTWSLEGWVISSKVPPDGDGIRTFPVSGDNLYPAWGEPPVGPDPGTPPDQRTEIIGPTDGARVEVTLDLVELELTFRKIGTESPPVEG